MKVIAKNQLRWGKKVVLPILGETTIPENGVLEVDSEVSILLIETNTFESYSQVEEIKPQTQETEELEKSKEVEEIKPQTTESEEIGKGNVQTHLETLSVSELQELAKPFPKKEWSSLRKQDLVSYLVNKL